MNNALKTMHMETITDKTAIMFYNILCAACEEREGGMMNADQLIVGDYAYMEQMKQGLLRDVAKRGEMVEFKNGKQNMIVENKSVQQIRSLLDQQRKHLSELRLTPSSRRAAPVILDDDFGSF